MTDDEVDLWESLYTKKDGYYERNKASEKELDEADDTLTVALLMNYQMGAMEEDTFKQLMAQQTGQDASVFENMTIEQIGEMMHVELKSFQQEKEDDDGNKVKVTCVDVRPIFAAMLESGQMDKDTVLSMRDSMEKTLDTMGSSLVKSMGIAYAVSADKAAGLHETLATAAKAKRNTQSVFLFVSDEILFLLAACLAEHFLPEAVFLFRLL